jgi:hypothetical protein
MKSILNHNVLIPAFAIGVGAFALTLSTRAQVTILDTGGFESYSVGVVNGQNGWSSVNAFGQPSQDATIAAAPGGHGLAMQFSDIGGANDLHTESGVQVSFADLGASYRFVRATFDFYREGDGLYNNLWWWPVGANPWSGLQWDNAASPSPGAQILPFGFMSPTTPSILMPQSQWVTIDLTFDLALGLEDAYVNGTLVGQGVNIGTGEFAGWFFDDTNTVDPSRSPNGVGQVGWIDNLVITAQVPEPSSLAILGLGFMALLVRRNHRG